MHLAIIGDHTDIAELILNQGSSSTEVLDNDGNSPLHLAVQSNNAGMVELLLRKGALTEAIDKDNNTPLLLAFKSGYNRIAELIIHQLKGSAIDTLDNDGNSPLHLAAHKNYGSLVTLLLSKGASPSTVNKNGKRPFNLAVSHDAYLAFRNSGVNS